MSKHKVVKYVIHDAQPKSRRTSGRRHAASKLAGFPEDARDAVAFASHSIKQAQSGDCDAALGSFHSASEAYGRADVRASTDGETRQVDTAHTKVRRAKAEVQACYRNRK